jgi:hypothetical protein
VFIFIKGCSACHLEKCPPALLLSFILCLLPLQLASLSEKFQTLDRRYVKLQEDGKHAKANMRKLQATIEQSTAAAAEARTTSERTAASLPQMEGSLASLEADRATEQAAYEAVLATLKGETEGLRLQMETQQALLTPAAEAAAAAAAELETTKTELRLLREQVRQLGLYINLAWLRLSNYRHHPASTFDARRRRLGTRSSLLWRRSSRTHKPAWPPSRLSTPLRSLSTLQLVRGARQPGMKRSAWPLTRLLQLQRSAWLQPRCALLRGPVYRPPALHFSSSSSSPGAAV